MNSNNYHFVRSFEIQVTKATNGQKNDSAEESILVHCMRIIGFLVHEFGT